MISLSAARQYLHENLLAAFGFIYVAIAIVLALIGPYITPYDPETAVAADYLLSPSREHWFGTDSSGMDILSRVVAAYRVDLVIAVVASVISLAVGAMLGVISGYYRNFGSESIARLADAAQSFPLFVLAMALVAATGPSAVNIIIVLGVLNIPMFIRLVRARTYALRESSYVEAARALGMRDRRLIVRHLLPNASPPALIQFSVNVGWAILFTAGLSFVGAGVRTPTPEWGLMVAAGAPSVVTGQWWPALFPGIFIGLTVFAFALVGDALEHLLDPTRR